MKPFAPTIMVGVFLFAKLIVFGHDDNAQFTEIRCFKDLSDLLIPALHRIILNGQTKIIRKCLYETAEG